MIGCGFFWIYQEIRGLKKNQRAYRRVYEVIEAKFDRQLPLLGGMPLPAELRNIPFADAEGIVLSMKQISIPNLLAPYNPSIIENGDHFNLFFRYDILDKDCPRKYYSHIGAVSLNHNLDLLKTPYITIETGSQFSEDPRAVWIGQELFLVFNDLLNEKSATRGIYLARLSPDDLSVKYITELDLRRKSMEKNWTPFAYTPLGGVPTLHFIYDITPLKVLKVADPTGEELPVFYEISGSALNAFQWPKVWGRPRGGTPARKIGDEYLSFFHSSFRDRDGINWYVIAAYTFQSKPPFRTTGISQYPILFQGAYDSPPLNTAHPCCRVLYPAGFVCDEKDGRELFYLACGENDSAIKILTIDKERLLKNMKKF
jgi:hypothetical protein